MKTIFTITEKTSQLWELSFKSPPMLKQLIVLIAFNHCTFFMAQSVFAHETPGGTDPRDRVYRYGHLLEAAYNVEAESERTSAPKATPYIKIRGKKYYLNNSFHQVTEEMIRIYSNDLQEMCPQCKIPDAKELAEQARSIPARTVFDSIKEKVAKDVVGELGSEFADLGSRYGATAGILKVAGEIAEETILNAVFMPTAHFLCEVVTWIIAARSGNFNTLARFALYANGLGQSRIRHTARLIATSWAMKWRMNRVQLELGPMQVDPKLFAEEKISDPRKHWLAHEISDEKKFRRFFTKLQQQIENTQQKIAQLENRRTTRNYKSIDRKIEGERRRLERKTRLSQKIFEGRRRGLTFYIIKRNGPKSLYSSEHELNRAFRGTKAWLVPMTATISEPGLVVHPEARPQDIERFIEKLNQNSNQYKDTPINRILTQEAAEKGVSGSHLKGHFADLEFIFDTTQNRAMRYNMAYAVQGFLEAEYNILKTMASDVRKEILAETPKIRTAFKLLGLHWHIGRLTNKSITYVDYLKSVSLVKGRTPLVNEKHFAKDFLTSLIEAHKSMHQLKEVPTLEEVMRIKGELKEKVQSLTNDQFWIEKRAHSGLFNRVTRLIGLTQYNLFRKRPQCRALY